MKMDWWSLFREARHTAWEYVGTIGRSAFEALMNMLFGGDLFQVFLAILIIGAFIYTSWRAILKIFVRASI